MSETTELLLYTRPSHLIRETLPPTEDPFRQVVAVQVGRLVCALEHIRGSQLGGGAGGELDVSSYTVPRSFAYRLVHYTEHYYGGGLRGIEPIEVRNCFQFGVWMARGQLAPRHTDALQLILDGARHTPRIAPHEEDVGNFTVIRPVPDFPREPVLHGMIRLDEKHYIQVMSKGGVLGVTDLDQPAAYRESPDYRRIVVAGRFGLDPDEWSVGHFGVSEELQAKY